MARPFETDHDPKYKVKCKKCKMPIKEKKKISRLSNHHRVYYHLDCWEALLQ